MKEVERHVLLRGGKVIAAGSKEHCQGYAKRHGGNVWPYVNWCRKFAPNAGERMAAKV